METGTTEGNEISTDAAESRGIVPEGWKSVPTLNDLNQDLSAARPMHDAQMQAISRWIGRFYVTGKEAPNTRKGFSSIQPRVIRKQAEWRFPGLSEPFLNATDLFRVTPRTFEDAESARQNELLLNYQFETKINRQAFIDEYVRNATREGTVIVKVVWRREMQARIVEVPKYELTPAPPSQEGEALMQALGEMLALRDANPLAWSDLPPDAKIAAEHFEATGIPSVAEITGFEEKEVQVLVANHPELIVCDYRSVVIDPSATKMEDAKFVMHVTETSMSELRRAGIYENLDMVNTELGVTGGVSATPGIPATPGDPWGRSRHGDDAGHGDTDGQSPSFNFTDKPRKRLVLREYWGYWDYKGDGIARPIVASWVGNVMVRLGPSPYPGGGLPFVAVPFMPLPNKIYGEPDGELLHDNQRVIGALMRGMIDVMARSANGQVGHRRDAVDAVNRRRMQNGEDFVFGTNVDPNQLFKVFEFPEIPASAQYMLQNQQMEAESMTGVKTFNEGISSGSLGAVATGIRGALSAASKREIGLLRRLAAGLVECARKIVAMNAEFLEDEEIVRVTNAGQVAVRREALAGDFDLRMDIATVEEDNEKAQELSFMLQTLGNNAPPEIVNMILSKIAHLRRMPELANAILNFKPTPSPEQQRMAQLDLAMREAELGKLFADTDEAYSMALLNRARARESDSRSDERDLTFVERESGTAHARALEMEAAKSDGKIQQEVVRENLKAEGRVLDNLMEQDNNANQPSGKTSE